MFARATASASGSTSLAHTSASGSANASASASAPDPVPRSATAYAVRPAPHGSCLPTRSPSRATSSMATWATTSVSGRGISTRRSTSSSIP